MAKRENGSGTTIRRKYANSTKYIAYSPARYYEDESGVTHTTRIRLGTFSTRREAREVLSEYLRHPSDKFAFTLKDVYEDWKKNAFRDLKGSTVTNWTTCWQKICDYQPSLTDKLMRDFNAGDVRDILNYYAYERTGRNEAGEPVTIPPLSKSYITKLKALLTQLCTHAMENNIIDKNYAALVKTPKLEAGKRRAFTDLEFKKLSDNWKTTPGGDACLVLCYTGFRVTEFCELTKFSYDPKTGILRGGMKTEAGKDRAVPVHAKIKPIIDAWYSDSKGPLYARPDGRPYNKDSFANTVWKPCMKSLGLPDDLTPHSARHTFGTRMSAAGARPEDIQRIMGHADYSMTANVYIDQDETALSSAISKMA